VIHLPVGTQIHLLSGSQRVMRATILRLDSTMLSSQNRYWIEITESYQLGQEHKRLQMTCQSFVDSAQNYTVIDSDFEVVDALTLLGEAAE